MNPVDLAATSVTAPTAAIAGQSITVNWHVTNPGRQPATGSWQDSVYLSLTPAITSCSGVLGTLVHTGGVAAGGSYDGSWTGELPALPPGSYSILVQVDSLDQVPIPDRTNDTLAASTGPLSVSLPALSLGTPYADAFTVAGQENYYQITVSQSAALTVGAGQCRAGRRNRPLRERRLSPHALRLPVRVHVAAAQPVPDRSSHRFHNLLRAGVQCRRPGGHEQLSAHRTVPGDHAPKHFPPDRRKHGTRDGGHVWLGPECRHDCQPRARLRRAERGFNLSYQSVPAAGDLRLDRGSARCLRRSPDRPFFRPDIDPRRSLHR